MSKTRLTAVLATGFSICVLIALSLFSDRLAISPIAEAAVKSTIKPSLPAKADAISKISISNNVPTTSTLEETVSEAQTDLFASKSWFVAPPPPPPEKPRAPSFPFTLLGSVDEENSTTLFLNRGDTNYIVHVGETIEANYRLDSIAAGTATFTYLPLKEQQRLIIGTR